MTRDDYLIVLLDMEAKYEALGKAIGAMRGALQSGCFTDPATGAAKADDSPVESGRKRMSHEYDYPDDTPTREEMEQADADRQPPPETHWFVESVIDGKFDGWFAAPKYGYGGWLTDDPTAAKKYTEAEARAVAHALTYFHSPFRYSNWVATEHSWMGANAAGTSTEEGE